MKGSKLNNILNLGGKQSLYNEDGKWYHQLTKFPGILFDSQGYIIFNRKRDYINCSDLKRKKHLNINKGISSISSYKYFSKKQIREITIAVNENKISIGRHGYALKQKNKPFQFVSKGPYSIINIVRNKSGINEAIEIKQLHRRIGEGLHKFLSNKYGKQNIGCDCFTGKGTYIDMVRKENEGFVFYEIKTFKELRRNIREAFGQLMEYSYWASHKLAKEMVIVSDKKITREVMNYLKFLRDNFSIPIYYQQFDLKKSRLLKRY